jgi:Arc/MetJ family transcription regulator
MNAMRTNIEIDDVLIRRAMQLYGCKTKREVVDLALRKLLGADPMTIDEVLAMQGRGWSGDLEAMKEASRRRAAFLQELRDGR